MWEIKNNPEWQKEVNESIIQPHRLALKSLKQVTFMDYTWRDLSHKHNAFKIAALKKRKRLTHRILQLHDDWSDWLQSEFKQLDQYKTHNMFGKPTKLPRNANLLHLLWIYLIKDDKTKKLDAYIIDHQI